MFCLGKKKTICKSTADWKYDYFFSFPAHISSLYLTLCIISIVVAVTATIAVYLQFEIEIKLFLRDTLSCFSTSSGMGSFALSCVKILFSFFKGNVSNVPKLKPKNLNSNHLDR